MVATKAIRMFEETYEQVHQIAAQRRWTLAVTLDEAAKALAEKVSQQAEAHPEIDPSISPAESE